MERFNKTLLAGVMGTLCGFSANLAQAGDSHLQVEVYADVAQSLSFVPNPGNGGTNGGTGSNGGETGDSAGDPVENPTVLSNGDTFVNGGVSKIDAPFMFMVEQTNTVSFMLFGEQEFFLQCDAYNLYKGGMVQDPDCGLMGTASLTARSGRIQAGDPNKGMVMRPSGGVLGQPPVDPEPRNCDLVFNPQDIDVVAVGVRASFASVDIGIPIVGDGPLPPSVLYGEGISSGAVPFHGGGPGKLNNMGEVFCDVTYKLINPEAEPGAYWGKVIMWAMQSPMG